MANTFDSIKPLLKDQYAGGSGKKQTKSKIAALLALRKKKGLDKDSSKNLPTPEKVASDRSLEIQSNIDPDDALTKKLFPKVSKLFKKGKQ